MVNLNVIAIDLAKNNYQVCKIGKERQVIYNKEVSRQKLLQLLVSEKQSLVAMESCGGTHYWARKAKEAGHIVKPMSARVVKAFRQGQKTDANDALAIGIAAQQPTVKPSRLLSVNEQCLQSISAMREHFVKQKVALGNLQRGCLLELGIPIAKSDSKLIDAVESLLEDTSFNVPMAFRASLKIVNEQFKRVVKEIIALEKLIEEEIKNDEVCERLSKLEGVVPVGSMMLKVYFSCIEHFKNGREASACAGLTPVQHSSGGKEKIGSISKKSANKKLRSTLYQGALAVVSNVIKRASRTEKDEWLKKLIARRGKKVAAIALANKTIRTAFAMLKKNECYQPKLLTA